MLFRAVSWSAAVCSSLEDLHRSELSVPDISWLKYIYLRSDFSKTKKEIGPDALKKSIKKSFWLLSMGKFGPWCGHLLTALFLYFHIPGRNTPIIWRGLECACLIRCSRVTCDLHIEK